MASKIDEVNHQSRTLGTARTEPRAQPDVLRDVANKATGRAVSQKRPASGIGHTTPPVLDWWRSQRLNDNTGGGPSQDHVSRAGRMTLLDNDACTPALKADDCEHLTEDDSWTAAQVRGLRRAQADTAASVPDFWGEVASNVEGRDALECQQKWFEHFATPRGRRKNAPMRGSTSNGMGTPLWKGTPHLLQKASLVSHDSRPPPDGPPKRSESDDLFQATPLRGRGRFGARRVGEVLGGADTPKTPVGPGACDNASAAGRTPGDGRTDYKRVVSRTYVQAVSKKMRQGASQLGKSRNPARGTASGKPMPCGAAGRTIHAAAVSRGRKMKASVTSTGAVSVACACSDEDSGDVSDAESDD